jgi:EF hand
LRPFSILVEFEQEEDAMLRFGAGVLSALLLVAAGLFFWRGEDGIRAAVPSAPVADETAYGLADLPQPATAPAKSKEEKRFNRYDKDKSGSISGEEYLTSRRKAYAKMDVNGDGVLQFSEYAVKTSTKFGKADGDRSGSLTRAEFATTRPIRKARPKPDCPPPLRQPEASAGEGDDDA